jgi:hypothetical protein
MKMSEAAVKDAVQARAGATRGSGVGGPPPQRPPSALRGPVIIGVGALVTAGVVAAALVAGSAASSSAPTSGEPMLPPALTASEIAAASVTLDPATSATTTADAKSCKAPMTWVTLVKAPGSPSGTVRVRSGSYLSPAFHVTEAPQRVAIPYPAPYPTGRGVLSVVGESENLSVYLTPGWTVQGLHGAASIHVWWRTDKPC